MNSTREPYLVTDPALAEVLAQLMRREPIFHRAEFGTTRDDFENMTTQDYWEVGASGRRYSRSYVLSRLEERFQRDQSVDVWETSEFYCKRLGADVYLLTYTLLQHGTRKTRRSTIWQQTHEGWKIVYHQGTLVEV
ncbi:MAG: DUF4440 domain-containing protein [Acidobacteriaceae bacterium]|jgi:hypothetical protein